MFVLLAQAANGDSLSSWVGILGTLGFAVWYGYYVTAVTIPKINTDNNALIEKVVRDFREEMKLEREDHTANMKAQREDCQREVTQIMAAFNVRVTNIKDVHNN